MTRLARWVFALWVLPLGCRVRSEPHVGPDASMQPSSVREDPLSACRDASASSDAPSAAQVGALIASCVGQTRALEVVQAATSPSELVVSVFDVTSGFSALASVEHGSAGLRVVALWLSSTWAGRALGVRVETLRGQAVVVETLDVDCQQSELPWPRRAVQEVGLGGGYFRPRLPADCPRHVERVWRRREASFELLGGYATSGEQRVDARLTRQFTSKVRFDGDRIHVSDDSTWTWWGAERSMDRGADVAAPEEAEAKTSSERVYLSEHGVLLDESLPEPIPKPKPAQGGWRPVPHVRSEPCAP